MSKPKMSQVLYDADDVEQIKFAYTRGWNGIKAEGYCALGLLACKSNSVSKDGIVASVFGWLIEKYDVTDKDLLKTTQCHLCDHMTGRLEVLIPHWNDQHDLSFKDIATELRKIKL